LKKNHNVYITNHRKPDIEISQNEFYSTHKDSVRTFLKEFLKGHSIQVAWEPACGKLNIVNVLRENGIEVLCSDIVSRGVGEFKHDFLSNEKCDIWIKNSNIDTIITNPPFSLAEKFIRTALKLKPSRHVIMYLKLTFLEGKKRYKLFKEFPPEEIYIHPSRQGCSPQGAEEFNNGGAVCYCWFVWKTNGLGNGIPKLYWLEPN
jgi:hypothetical protein